MAQDELLDYKLTEAHSNKLLLIMTGIDGSLSGYNGKYDIIANDMKENFDISTLVVALPFGAWNYMEQIFNFSINKIEEYFNDKGIKDYEIFAMGSSAGGTNILLFMKKCPKISKICAINPVFSVNFDKILKNLKSNHIKKTIILGERDMSISDYQLLQKIEDVNTIVIPNGDHNLSGEDNFKFFLDIPKMFFIDKK